MPAEMNVAEMKFAWIPPGHSLTGGNGQNDNPQRKVTITKGFWMGIYLVTQGQWQAAMGYNPSHFRGDDRPVEQVSWDDCQEFCAALKRLTGKPIRLPTEAEWEYACRAGTTTEYWNANGEEALKQVGWYMGNSGRETKPVGKLPANVWGLFDVHGNVWEWCQDLYGTLTSGDVTDPFNGNNGDARVCRGGSWGDGPVLCRAAYRLRYAPGARLSGLGLRVCFRLDG